MVAIRKPFFVVPVDLGANVTPSNVAAGYPASNVRRLESMGLVYRQVDGRGGKIGGQFAATTAVDFAALISGTFEAAWQWDLRLGTGAYGSGPWTYYSGALPRSAVAYSRADGRYHTHFEMPGSINADWWEITWSAQATTIEFAGIVMGKKIEPSRYYDKDFERGMEDLGSIELNRFAVPDVTPGAKLRTLNFTLSWLNEAEYEDTFAPLAQTLGTTQIVYCCFDPAVTAWRQNRTYMGWLRNPPFARGGAKPRNMAMEFQLRSLI